VLQSSQPSMQSSRQSSLVLSNQPSKLSATFLREAISRNETMNI
jgi:hypothetical protein